MASTDSRHRTLSAQTLFARSVWLFASTEKLVGTPLAAYRAPLPITRVATPSGQSIPQSTIRHALWAEYGHHSREPRDNILLRQCVAWRPASDPMCQWTHQTNASFQIYQTEKASLIAIFVAQGWIIAIGIHHSRENEKMHQLISYNITNLLVNDIIYIFPLPSQDKQYCQQANRIDPWW